MLHEINHFVSSDAQARVAVPKRAVLRGSASSCAVLRGRMCSAEPHGWTPCVAMQVYLLGASPFPFSSSNGFVHIRSVTSNACLC
jgi:hypothetical protein